MAQSIKCLWWNGDLSLDPQHPHKEAGMAAYSYNPALQWPKELASCYIDKLRFIEKPCLRK